MDFCNKLVFVPGKLLQPSLMFPGKTRDLPQSRATERCFTWVGSGLTQKHYTRLERLARDKHSSLLRKSVTYGRKKFYSTGQWCDKFHTEGHNFSRNQSVVMLSVFIPIVIMISVVVLNVVAPSNISLCVTSIKNYVLKKTKKTYFEKKKIGIVRSGNTKGGSITVPLTSCLTGLDQSVQQTKTIIASCHTVDSKPVKQEVNGKVILPPLVFPGQMIC